ncbi:hypothetical protein [Methanogenium cariaci]|uniref:hypothetical protein n=1 Tax=Methanogenium cariaci TaxID=2197 RepID=UPI001FE125FE|nr:hypothetical protein [Methanogenium cariaci]
MRIKICGVTSPEDACLAEEAGADAVGVVVFSDSPRSVAVERAGEIFDALGPFTTGVCVTATENAEDIDEMLALRPPRRCRWGRCLTPPPHPPRSCPADGCSRRDAVPACDAVVIDASRGGRDWPSAGSLPGRCWRDLLSRSSLPEG